MRMYVFFELKNRRFIDTTTKNQTRKYENVCKNSNDSANITNPTTDLGPNKMTY